MREARLMAVMALMVIIGVVFLMSSFIIDTRKTAFVLRFGKVVRTYTEPGLRFKLPWERARFFDKRILTLDAAPQVYLTAESKELVVDSFVKWRIVDTQKFYVTVGGLEETARARLEPIIDDGLRAEFGKRPLRDIISGDRAEIMTTLRTLADKAAREFGIEIVDVRLQRVDLSKSISSSVYLRMQAERKRIANDHRAKGVEKGEEIRARAERESREIEAKAYRDAERIRGEGDARAIAIYAQALKRDPEFYKLYRSLIAYKASFKDKGDLLIIDPSSDFFRYLKRSQ